ncbi:MAG: sugar phosphate isomerase/epimerase [Solirubrobacteraceae bacterium]|nr:sugar phosphate isomerase/epimerase [Solirubrobacteraceae bacterium]
MSRSAKISRGSWCVAFGMDPMPSLEQVLKVFSAFEYDGIELAGFFDHATVERYPDAASRRKLVDLVASYDLEIAGYAPGPYGDFGRLPWATGSDEVLAEYRRFFDAHLQFCVDTGISAMRVDPGDFGPLPRDADYERVWDRVVSTFRDHAERGAREGVQMLWEYETGQVFVKPSEIVRMFDDVDHDNFKLMYDVGHIVAGVVLGHNQVQPVEKLEGGQLELLSKLHGRIGHVHLCDSDNNTWQNAFGTHLGFGKGNVDFDALIPALLDAGYEGEWWSVDAIPMSSETWADTWDGKLWLEDALDRHVRPGKSSATVTA